MDLWYPIDMKPEILNYDVIVIGGGASGMMAAGQAASRGKKVLLLEKNISMGEKLKITGGGRCNITNDEQDIREFLKNYGQASHFLFSAFHQFNAKNTFDFFESKNLPLVVQARNRVFPQTEKALDVFYTLKKFMESRGVMVKTNSAVKKIVHDQGKILRIITDAGQYRATNYILATGGVSHPETGSTGDGFRWLSKMGHTVHPPTPTIVPLAVAEDWVKSLAGISLSFMKISFLLDGKRQFSKTGKVLFTHFGLSGPLILNSAAKVGELLRNGEVTAQIDAFPDTDLGALDDKVVKIFNANQNKAFKTVLKEIVPAGTWKGILLLLSDMNLDIPVNSVTRDERKRLVNLLKALPVTITNLMGNDRAVSADGGVSLTEIDTRTMKSKIMSNLFVTGDLLHINRPSGGYSLQLCWTTGFIAGNEV